MHILLNDITLKKFKLYHIFFKKYLNDSFLSMAKSTLKLKLK